MHPFKPFWGKILGWNWKFGCFMVFLLGIPRFWWVLEANSGGTYQKVSLIFVLMAVLPFVLLNRTGRKTIGIVRPKNGFRLIEAFMAGLAFGLLVYCLGQLLFGQTLQNWYCYISQSYQFPTEEWRENRLMYFSIFALVGMTFSPIGEEFFYRGLVHESIAVDLGQKNASFWDSLAFSLTHLAHFGIVWTGLGWTVFWIPALIWMAMIFLLGKVFYWYRVKSQSIWGAVLSHAGFNLAMTWTIFYLIL
ncbi:CPBP family intramembrane glutamic endopeptidase [Pararhodonellum marinum]|uniref:CPBP family intramembrane glutamic endopeptidase n=1 Tax=Pararhodonellum marinum TaxID=2755358 RepID=UPI00188EA199|nr:CPBP family intramembrane glutamic endopeptidase [Pararhodonellum marinum]